MTERSAAPAVWGEMPDQEAEAEPPGPLAQLARSLVPGLVVAALFLLLGRPVAAGVIAVVATTVAVAATRSERFRRAFERALHAVGRAVAAVLSAVLMFLVEVFVFAPLSFLAWLFRRDPLRYGSARRAGGWSPAGTGPAAGRPFAVDPPGPAPTRAGRVVRAVPRVVGWVAIVLAVDLAVGLLVARVGDDDIAESDQVAAATEDAPWFSDYLSELRAVRADFSPFVLGSERDQTGRYINLRDGVRRSYQPATDDEDLPVVYFFGGTNVWGEGQRDGHTVASEVARLAEEDGHPIRVVNRAQRGDVNFAAVLRFERALIGAAPAPDLVVFADGPDDYRVQRQSPSADPGQYGLEAARATLVHDDRSLWERYSEASLLHRVVSRVQAVFSVQPAGAEGDDEEDLAADVASVYERGRRLAAALAADAGVPIRFFWLPIDGGDGVGSTYGAAADALDPSVTDLRDSLDAADGPVYLDETQVNEVGARLVAEAMYESLRPQIEQLSSP